VSRRIVEVADMMLVEVHSVSSRFSFVMQKPFVDRPGRMDCREQLGQKARYGTARTITKDSHKLLVIYTVPSVQVQLTTF
jgi:hypothetical protein